MSSFFLLGKGPDNDLILLSSTPVGSRKEALAELSRLTAESGFDHWDAEVFVLDLETGTPVLLMRPEAPAPAPAAPEASDDAASDPEAAGEPEEIAAEEPSEAPEVPVEEPSEELAEAAGEEPAEERSEEPEEAAGEPEEIAAEEPSEELVLATEAAREVAAAAAEDEGEVDEALAAVIEDLAYEATGDAVVVESPVDLASAEDGSELETVEEAYAEAVLEAAADEPSTLKAALERTAAQMAASGITPPESVGPAEPEAAGIEASPEPAAPEAAWPWATSGEDEGAAFTIAALEEPGVDEGSLVRAAGDDETMAVSRPVILGAYEEGPVEQAPAEEPQEPVVPAPAEPLADIRPDLAAEAPATGEPESDFILDLEQITAAPAQEPAGYQAPEAPTQMTCNDCVYVETCPNKDQRDPASCGSFQWK